MKVNEIIEYCSNKNKAYIPAYNADLNLNISYVLTALSIPDTNHDSLYLGISKLHGNI